MALTWRDRLVAWPCWGWCRSPCGPHASTVRLWLLLCWSLVGLDALLAGAARGCCAS